MRRARERGLPAAERRDPLGREEGEERVELVEELGEPLEREVLGDDDEDALGDAELAHAGEDEARLDRLAEADLVREDEARQAVGEDAAGRAHLVREDVDARREERPSESGAAERLEPGDAGAERERGGGTVLARGERIEGAAGPSLLERGVGRYLGERGVAAGDDRHALAPRSGPRAAGPRPRSGRSRPRPSRAGRGGSPSCPFSKPSGRPLTIRTRAGPARPSSGPALGRPPPGARPTVDTGRRRKLKPPPLSRLGRIAQG